MGIDKKYMVKKRGTNGEPQILINVKKSMGKGKKVLALIIVLRHNSGARKRQACMNNLDIVI